MNKLAIAAIIGVFIFSYIMLNYYIGLRGWQAFSGLMPKLAGKLYWAVFWFLAVSYLAGRLGEKFLPDGITYFLTIVGAYWLASMFYFILVLVAVDLVRLTDRLLGYLPEIFKLRLSAPVMGLAVVTIVLGTVGYGAWNARNPVVTRYELDIPKKAGAIRELHVAMVSDSHLGEIIHNGRLNRMVEMINGINPDIVLMPGDIIDEDIGPFVEQRMTETFRKLQPKFGIFAVPGNHEYIGGHIDTAVRYLEEAGVLVLRDSHVKIADSFYVIGRDDRSRQRFGGNGREKLPVLMEGLDASLPVIVLDHQPSELSEAAANGVDLQLSGHTHRGQLFPNHLITRRIFEVDWGLLQKDGLQVIVSSGFGTWGPPIRVGNRPEVVEIVIRFRG